MAAAARRGPGAAEGPCGGAARRTGGNRARRGPPGRSARPDRGHRGPGADGAGARAPASRQPGPGRARGRLRGHGLHRGRRARGGDGLVQLQALNSSGASGARHVRHHVPRPRRARDGAAAHAHVTGADPPDGGGGARRHPAHSRRHAGQVLPPRHARRPPPSRVQSDRGLVVDRDITFGDFAGTIQTFTAAYFGPGMRSRLRPAYFPFTEPSASTKSPAPSVGRGLSPARNGLDRARWLRHGRSCGLRRRGIDADEWSGFAFGFGIDRLAQMRHAIPDMRSFLENDIRFLSQF